MVEACAGARWYALLLPAPVRMLRLYFPECLAPRRSVPLRGIAGGSVVSCPILVDAGCLACALVACPAERICRSIRCAGEAAWLRGEGRFSRVGGAISAVLAK